MLKIITIGLLCFSVCGCGTKILSRKAYEAHIVIAYQMGVKDGAKLPFSQCHKVMSEGGR